MVEAKERISEPMRPRAVNWGQAFAEVFLILVGIGLALLADSWMDSRRERQEERQYLIAITSDLEKTKESLESTLQQVEWQKREHLRLIQVLQGPKDELTEEELVTYLENTFLVFPPSGVFGTYQDMVSSGNLRLIRNAKIRLALAKYDGDWRQLLSRSVEEGYDQWNQLQVPFVVSNFNLTSTYLRNYRGTSMPDGYTYKPIDREKVWSQEFENILVIAVVSNVDQIHEFERRIADADSILAMIADELAQWDSPRADQSSE